MAKSIILSDHEAACKNLGLIVVPVKGQPDYLENPNCCYLDFGHSGPGFYFYESEYPGEGTEHYSPPWQPGQILAVREAWAYVPIREEDGGQGENMGPIYLSDGESAFDSIPNEWEFMGKWNSPATMPLKFARRKLRIESVTCKLVSEVTEEEAVRAGVGSGFKMNAGWPDYQSINKSGICELTQDTAYASFWSLWNKRYGKRFPFETTYAWFGRCREEK